jgi:Protein of unknown function (DUF3309)
VRGTKAEAARYRHQPRTSPRPVEAIMSSTVLIVVLVILLIGALPNWGHSRSWGYAPSGLLGTVLVILVILALMGRL